MYTFIFQIQKLENKLTLPEKELQQARKDNQALTRYINARRKEEAWRKEEEARKKAEEEAQKKAMVVA
jgi:predicted Holliday junction resolvase-like endonuclease